MCQQFCPWRKNDKCQVWVEPVEVPAPAGGIMYVVCVTHLQAVTWSLRNKIFLKESCTVYLTFLKYTF